MEMVPCLTMCCRFPCVIRKYASAGEGVKDTVHVTVLVGCHTISFLVCVCVCSVSVTRRSHTVLVIGNAHRALAHTKIDVDLIYAP
jgi:hypothetical protein